MPDYIWLVSKLKLFPENHDIINKQTLEDKIMNNKIVLIILSILLAPLAVYLKKGAGKELVINILLCFIFYIPAVIHALWLVTK